MTKAQAEAMNKRFVEMNTTIRQMADRELITQQQKDSLLGALQYCEYQFQVSQLGFKSAMAQYNELKFKKNDFTWKNRLDCHKQALSKEQLKV